MTVFKRSVVLSTVTHTEDEKFTKRKGEAGSHTAQSAIRRCFAQQCSWVIGWLHGVLMAQWPPVQGLSAFLEIQGEQKKSISSFQRTTIKCKISQRICWKHWHNYPLWWGSLFLICLVFLVFQMENIFLSGCVEQNTSVDELFRRCKYLMLDYAHWITFTSTVITWACVGMEKQYGIINLTCTETPIPD